jgi:hypothetical protein
MKRAIQLIQELNVTLKTFEKYCETIGLVLNNVNQKIDFGSIEKIMLVHQGKYKIETIPPINEGNQPEEFNSENPFTKNILELVQEHDAFQGRIKRLIKHKEASIDSIFSDFEAFSICHGLEDKHAKFIARNYFKNPLDNSNLIEAHFLATKVLDKYGSKTLSFSMHLPPLPFRCFDAQQIFLALDKRGDSQSYPALRIAYKNNIGFTEKVEMAFLKEFVDDKKIKNKQVIVVKNKTTGSKLMSFTRSGIIIPEPNASDIVPVIQLFIKFSANPGEMILHYGLETGECSICGRELTDSKSILKGIGPVCETYL